MNDFPNIDTIIQQIHIDRSKIGLQQRYSILVLVSPTYHKFLEKQFKDKIGDDYNHSENLKIVGVDIIIDNNMGTNTYFKIVLELSKY